MWVGPAPLTPMLFKGQLYCRFLRTLNILTDIVNLLMGGTVCNWPVLFDFETQFSQNIIFHLKGHSVLHNGLGNNDLE